MRCRRCLKYLLKKFQQGTDHVEEGNVVEKEGNDVYKQVSVANIEKEDFIVKNEGDIGRDEGSN